MALNVLNPDLMTKLMGFLNLFFVCLFFCKTNAAVIIPAYMGQVISICPIIADVHFVYLA